MVPSPLLKVMGVAAARFRYRNWTLVRETKSSAPHRCQGTHSILTIRITTKPQLKLFDFLSSAIFLKKKKKVTLSARVFKENVEK